MDLLILSKIKDRFLFIIIIYVHALRVKTQLVNTNNDGSLS